MPVKWMSTNHPGVRYYEHPTNKTKQGRADRYFAIRYTDGEGKRREEGVGWLSNGITLDTAVSTRDRIVRNIRTGTGPQSLKSLRLAEARGVANRENLSLQERRDRLTVANLWDRYIDWACLHKRSHDTEAYNWQRHLEPRFGNLLACQVSRGHVQQVVQDLLQGDAFAGTTRARTMSPATVERQVALLRKIFSWAAEEPLEHESPEITLFDGRNPASRIRIRVPDNARWRILTRAEASRIVQDAAGNPLLQLLIELSLGTGLRRDELCALQRQHVLLDQRIIRAVDTKNDTSRTVRIPEHLADRLTPYTLGTSPHLFPSRRGRGHFPVDSYTRQFGRLPTVQRLNAGITDTRARIVVHTLRHTFATWAIMDGMDVLVLKRLLGHKRLETTERYVHLAADFLHAAAGNLRPADAAPSTPAKTL